jgi:hypothetical protein
LVSGATNRISSGIKNPGRRRRESLFGGIGDDEAIGPSGAYGSAIGPESLTTSGFGVRGVFMIAFCSVRAAVFKSRSGVRRSGRSG